MFQIFVIHLGFEPKTPTLKVLCSTNWANESLVIGLGIEPKLQEWKSCVLAIRRTDVQFV